MYVGTTNAIGTPAVNNWVVISEDNIFGSKINVCIVTVSLQQTEKSVFK